MGSLLAKLKESVVSVAPMMLVVVLLHGTIAPLLPGQLPLFLVSGVMIIVGLSVFLMGVDLGMVPFGQRLGSSLIRKQNLALILIVAFCIGFAIALAEPMCMLFAGQVSNVAPAVDKSQLLRMTYTGVGIFLLIAAARTVFGWSLRWVLIISYTALFIACGFMDAGFVGLAFDGGGVSTGPITVPFVIAVGLGMAAATRKKESADNSFGMAAIASIGPAAALAVMGLVSTASVGSVAYEAAPYVEMPILARCLGLLPEVAMEIFMALSPIFISLLIFQALLLKLPAQQVIRMITGLVYTFIGLVIFMLGVKSGFMLAGESLGNALGGTAGGLVLIPVGLILGAVVVCAEPAVWVLTAQVEEVSGGHIKRSIMFTVLSLSVAIAVCLGMVRVVFGFSIWWLLLPGYALALVFTKFCPPLFTGIAFDSGSVCTGPMAGTVVLALTLGGAAAVGGNPAVDGFGMVAMIALAPPIAIQLLGMLFQYKKKQAMNSTTTTGTAQ